MGIPFCLNVVLYVLDVNVQVTIGQQRSKKKTTQKLFFPFICSHSICMSVLFFLPSVPISLFPPLATLMPLISLYTALIIKNILCRQWVLVPWALWSRIYGINAGWQASLRPRTPSPGQGTSVWLTGQSTAPDPWAIMHTADMHTHTCAHTHFEDFTDHLLRDL